MAAAAAVVLLAILSVFWVWTSTQLRSELFTVRKDQILEDASVRFAQAQRALGESKGATPDQLQESVSQILNTTKESAAGAGAVEILLLRTDDASDTFRINEYVSPELDGIITPALQRALSFDVGQWQSATLPETSPPEPAIVVGTLVDVPLAGTHQLYIVYSLADEQATMNLFSSVLLIGSVPITFGIAALTAILVYRLLRPVRAAVSAAEKLAAGDLDVRVEVDGRDEMARLGSAFNEMADSLQQKITDYDNLSHLQQRFVSDVSHELRTPMTTIRIADEVIYESRESLDPAAKRSAELLHSEVGRLEQMLADLLEISRYDAQQTQIEGESTDLYALVERVVEANHKIAEHLNVHVELSPRPARASLPVDPKRVERVIRNLLVNAYEHAEEGEVRVTVGTSEDSVAVRVRDFGVGMDEQTVAHVFDRFYRANPSRTRTTGGSGLGLAIAKEDVALHGGHLTVESRLGEGTAFVVTLPRKISTEVTDFPLKAWYDNET